MMTFLYPFILGLGILVAVPFIIHLMGEKKYEPLKFSSLKFLREIERESLQKLHLRQWLILASRALWIAMIVFALALPYINTTKGSLEPGIFIIDKSYSTSIDPDYLSLEISLRDHYSNWSFLDYSERTDPDSLKANAEKIIEKEKLNQKNIYILSDLQDNKLNRNILEKLKPLSENIVMIKAPKLRTNFAIKNLSAISYYERGKQSVRMELSASSEMKDERTIKIQLNGQEAGQTRSDGNGYAEFNFTAPEISQKLCVAEAPGDDYPEDNRRYLVLKDLNQINILIVDKGETAYYHRNALKAMDRIKTTVISPDQLLSTNPESYDIIWFSDLYPISKNMKKLLLDYADEKPILLNAGLNAGSENGWQEITGPLRSNEKKKGYHELKDLRSDLPAFRILNYYHSSKTFNDIIWESDNKEAVFVKAEKKIFIMLSPFHFEWNEMGLSPYFTRAVSEMLTLMLGIEDMACSIGEPIQVDGVLSTVTTPTGEKFRVKDAFWETNTPGFYRITNERDNRLIAVNIPSDECVQKCFEPSGSVLEFKDGDDISDIDKQVRGRQAQTLFLILAAIFIILEMILLQKGERTK